MTEDQIQSALSRLNVNVSSTKTADGKPAFVAVYAELPGCLAEADTREEALLELQAIAPFFLRKVLDAGGALPTPGRALAPQTNMVTFHNVLVGRPSTRSATTATKTDLQSPARVTELQPA